MFERFTEGAREVVVLAQDEARSLGHGYIGTEHILLGLLRAEEGLAARVLVSFGVTIEAARARVVRAVVRGEQVSPGEIPFTPRAKKVLELSLREAIQLRHRFIGTEHILLGLAREHAGVASRILLDHGADAERIREEVLRLLPEPGPTRPHATAEPAPSPAPVAETHAVADPVPRHGTGLPLAAIALGWFGFGVAVGIGLLLGWLIWA